MNTAPRRTLLLGTENSDGTVTGVTAASSSNPLDTLGLSLTTVYLRSVGTTSGGTVLVETADWGPLETVYSGTWATIATISASSFTGGAQTQVAISPAALRFIRVRISNPITGGGTILASAIQQGTA